MRVSCNVSALPGAYIVEAGVLSSGAVYAWFNDRFCAGNGAGAERFAGINAEAASAPPGASGVLLLPHFKGSGSPHWNPNAKGRFFGLSLGTTRGDMARSILEGIAGEMAESIALIEELTGEVSEVRVSGGLSSNSLYNQIQADMYGKKVVRPRESEATARGAWIAAAVELGIYKSYALAYEAVESASDEYYPDEVTAAVYAKLMKRRMLLYRALAEGGVYDLS
jgi:sugar (pentulose or hexulose) kinase